MLTIEREDTLSTIAARVFPGGDVRRFFEILDENPSLDVLGDLVPGESINLPSTEQIQSFAQPVFGKIADSVAGARGFTSQIEQAVSNVVGQLPSELQGYAKGVLDLVDEANNVLSEVESTTDVVSQLRQYSNQTNLIQWLLSGKV